MFHTASYFPLKQAGDISLWSYTCVVWAHVSVCLYVCLFEHFIYMCVCVWMYVDVYVSMTEYLSDSVFWCKIKRFPIMCQIVSHILPPCNVTLTHWHVKWELIERERKPKREWWEVERTEIEKERLKIHLRNSQRDTTSDIGNFCRKITSS